MAPNIPTYTTQNDTTNNIKFLMDLLILTYLRCLKLCGIGKLKSFCIAKMMKIASGFDVVCRIEYEEHGNLQRKLICIKGICWKNDEEEMTLNKLRKFALTIKMEIFASEKIKENCTRREGSKKEDGKESSENLTELFNCQLKDFVFLFYLTKTNFYNEHFQNVRVVDHITTILDTSDNTGVFEIKKNFEWDDYLSCDRIKSLIDQTWFIHKLRLYINQKKECVLEDLIKTEIRDLINDKLCLEMKLNLIYSILCTEMNYHFRLPICPFLTEATNFIEEANPLVNLQVQTQELLKTFGDFTEIFRNEYIDNLYKLIMEHKFLKIPSNSLTTTKILVQCIQLAEKMKKNSKSTEDVLFLYLENSESFEMWKKIRTFYSYTKHSLVFLCVDINVRSEDVDSVCEKLDGDRERIIRISEECPVFDPSLLMEISPIGLEKIMSDTKITFQSIPVQLKDFLGDTISREILSTIINPILRKEKIIIGNSLPDKERIYIERKYKTNAEMLKFHAINEKGDEFLIFPKREKIKNSGNILTFENEAEAWEYFSSCRKSDKNTHFCYVDTSLKTLLVIMSKGTMRNILKYKIESDEMKEDAFLQHVRSRKCTIISANVDMGKTTALKRLSHSFKNYNNDYWVEYINVQDKLLPILQDAVTTPDEIPINDQLAAQIEDQVNYPSEAPLEASVSNSPKAKVKDHVEILAELMNLDDIGKRIFLHKCKTDGKIALFLDCFDGISSGSTERVLAFLKDINKTPIKSIVISTRPDVETETICSFGKVHFNIAGFNYDDLRFYLIEYLSQNPKWNKENLEKNVNVMMYELNEMKNDMADIIAVPLQTRMLVETYYEKIKNYTSEENLPAIESVNLYSLFDNFISFHIDRFMKENFVINERNLAFRELVKDKIFTKNSKVWEALACEEMFPEMKICEMKKLHIEEIGKIGLVRIFVNKTPEKITLKHRLYAMFLSAKYISRSLFEPIKLEHLNFIYRTILIDKKFIVLRKFINAFFGNEGYWETAEINYVPQLVLKDDVLLVAANEQNEFLFKAIYRHQTQYENVLKDFSWN